MNEREARQLVGLHQGEGRARHLDRLVAGEIADQRARESRFAGAEIARQRHEIAGFERGGDVGREALRRLLVRQCHGKACAARGGQKHEARYRVIFVPSAAVSVAVSASGNVHVTVVPCPTAEIDRHRAAVQFDERADQRKADSRAAMLRAERMRLEPVEHFFKHIRRNSGTRSVTEKTTLSAPRSADSVTIAPAGRKAHGVGQEIEEDLPHPQFVGDKAADVRGRADVEREACAHQPILHAFGGRRHGFADIDRPEIELHAAGIDRRQIENIVDQRQQRIGRNRDVVEIFALLVAPADRSPDRRAGERSR